MDLPQLAGYTINKELASGGMAKIYDAIQISLDRPVAIKFLNQQLSNHPEAQALFESESLIVAKLNHPNIVQVIDKGITCNSQPYFVMEKIIGIDLSQMLSGGELPLGKKLDIAIQICKGLAYAHRNEIIHRDIKPSNIIIDHHSDVKILDFGIAITNNQQSSSQQKSSVLGTQGYVSPEQQEDYTNATVASDIYSVGIVFYDLFGSSFTGKKRKSNKRLKNVPDNLTKLINKCCHEKITSRFQSLDEVRDELLKVSQGSHLGINDIQESQNENKDLSGNFTLLDVLEKNKDKRVYLFQKKHTRQLIVIKRTIVDSQGLKEAQYLSSLKHPNIVNILAAVTHANGANIITEYLSGGSLTNMLIKDMSEDDFLIQAKQICSAIYFAHKNNILHNNLYPNNILFDAKKNIKITDFGRTNSSKQIKKKYQPPTQQKFSQAFDIYCLGAIFHHMLYGAPPGEKIPLPVRKVSFRLSRLIEQMLSLNPFERPVTGEVMVEIERMESKVVKKKPQENILELIEKKQAESNEENNQNVKVVVKNSIWLITALSVSVLWNIAFLLDFFLH